MALFKRDFAKPGPGVPKNAPRKKGAARFFELVGREAANLMKLNLLYILCLLPAQGLFAAALYSWAGGSTGLFLAFGLGALAASVLVGPAMATLYNQLTRMLRDEPGFFWHGFKKTFVSNFKNTLVPGVLYSLLIASQVIAIAYYFMAGGAVPFAVMVVYLFAILIFNMAAPYFFMQATYLELSSLSLLKNSLILALGYLPRSIGGMALSSPFILLQLVGVYVFPPLVFVLLVMGVSLPCLVKAMWYWPQVDKTFGIEKTLRERKAREVDDHLAGEGIEVEYQE